MNETRFMSATKVVILFLVLYFKTVQIQASGGCRTLNFLDCIKNKAFVNHTIETFIVPFPGLELCRRKCYMNGACVSYNMGPTRGSTRRCELSDTDHVGYPDHVVANEGFEYCAVKSPCSRTSCSGNLVCRPDFSWDLITCVCSKVLPLGMQDNRIPDSAITASSAYDSKHKPKQARLHFISPPELGFSSSCWSAKVNRPGEFLQVDLGGEFWVERVATQGRPVGRYSQWITSYTLNYSTDATAWSVYKEGGTRKIFQGNKDTDTVVTNRLDVPIKAQFIRIVVQTWYGHISMRTELYGCKA